jgi:hypothetical protein
MMKPAMLALAAAALTAQAAGRSTYGDVAMPAAPPGSDCAYPANCPDKVLPRKDKQTWQMNQSTIIMPCNNTGFTDPSTTLGWGIVDFDWSNGKGTGTADGWVKHSPMDDEELLFKQVQMTAAATPGTTVWIYRYSVYAYPWYTSVRTLLDDPAYAPWFIDFNNQSGWYSLGIYTVILRSLRSIFCEVFADWLLKSIYQINLTGPLHRPAAQHQMRQQLQAAEVLESFSHAGAVTRLPPRRRQLCRARL